jgi:hypothetical protein
MRVGKLIVGENVTLDGRCCSGGAATSGSRPGGRREAASRTIDGDVVCLTYRFTA